MQRPRVKPEHSAFRIANGAVRLGGQAYGTAAEVNDPTGAVWTLLQVMDGSRSVDEVVRQVLARHRDESAQAVRRAVDTFIDAGYIEDAAAPDPPELTERDKERYDRNRAYFRWLDLTPRTSSWQPQVAIGRARVTVLGLGGTGGVAAMALAASGVGHLHCIDDDVVELSNLNRQVLYTEDDLGRPKVDAAVDRLRRLNSDIEITGVRQRVERSEDLLPLATGCDVMVMAADRPLDIWRWTNRACLAAGTSWVDAGYHGPLISVGTYLPGKEGCWECLRAADGDRHRDVAGNPQDVARRRTGMAAASGAASAGISGYLAAHCALALITGVPAPPVGQVHGVNLFALDAPYSLSYPRQTNCPACGDPA